MSDMLIAGDPEEFSYREELSAYPTKTLRATKSLRDQVGRTHPAIRKLSGILDKSQRRKRLPAV
jgi:hypothetical protein